MWGDDLKVGTMLVAEDGILGLAPGGTVVNEGMVDILVVMGSAQYQWQV